MGVWEGSELNCYFEDGCVSVSLSDIQFLAIAKILGLKIDKNGNVHGYNDEHIRNSTLSGCPVQG